MFFHWPLIKYLKLRVTHALGMTGRFSRAPTSKETTSYRSRLASRLVRHARAVMHVGIANPRWQGKRSRHSRRMRNPQFTYLVRGLSSTGQGRWQTVWGLDLSFRIKLDNMLYWRDICTVNFTNGGIGSLCYRNWLVTWFSWMAWEVSHEPLCLARILKHMLPWPSPNLDLTSQCPTQE